MSDAALLIEEEEWKVIQAYPCYAVSNLGRVKRIIPGKTRKICSILKPLPHSNGYRTVSLGNGDGKFKKVLIHLLVANAFLGAPPSDKHQINHKDGDKTRNCTLNIEWATVGENLKHAYKIGLHKPMERKGRYGGPHNARFYEGEVWLIKRLLHGKIRQCVIAKMFECSQTIISDINRNISYQTPESFEGWGRRRFK
jgi:hypothetical protein